MSYVYFHIVKCFTRADEEAQAALHPEESNQAADDDSGEGEAPLSPTYENLIALGQQIGDVKAERWAFVAQAAIDSLPLTVHSAGASQDAMYVPIAQDYLFSVPE